MHPMRRLASPTMAHNRRKGRNDPDQAISANEQGLNPHYKVRVMLPNVAFTAYETPASHRSQRDLGASPQRRCGGSLAPVSSSGKQGVPARDHSTQAPEVCGLRRFRSGVLVGLLI